MCHIWFKQTRALKTLTPHETWSRSKPSIAHLRTFRSLVYAHVPSQKWHKLDSRASSSATVTRAKRIDCLTFPHPSFLSVMPFSLKTPLTLYWTVKNSLPWMLLISLTVFYLCSKIILPLTSLWGFFPLVTVHTQPPVQADLQQQIQPDLPFDDQPSSPHTLEQAPAEIQQPKQVPRWLLETFHWLPAHKLKLIMKRGFYWH